MCDGSLQIPVPRTFDNSSEQFPYVIVGDDAIPLSENLLKLSLLEAHGKHIVNPGK